jgi:hypothetical protein
MDVFLINDKPEEGAWPQREWGNDSVSTLQIQDLAINEANQLHSLIGPNAKQTIIHNINSRKVKLDRWLVNPRKSKPSSTLDWDRDEFIGFFSLSLGNPDLLELLRKS